jgi:hypothetical protein
MEQKGAGRAVRLLPITSFLRNYQQLNEVSGIFEELTGLGSGGISLNIPFPIPLMKSFQLVLCTKSQIHLDGQYL